MIKGFSYSKSVHKNKPLFDNVSSVTLLLEVLQNNYFQQINISIELIKNTVNTEKKVENQKTQDTFENERMMVSNN